jgi:hypothetical protein
MAETKLDGRLASSPRITKIRNLFERIEALNPRSSTEADEKQMEGYLDEFQDLAAEVWRHPATDWSGIIERVLLAWHYETAGCGGGPISLTDPTLSHAELTRRHLLTALIMFKPEPSYVRLDVPAIDALDEQLDKLSWLSSIALLAGTHIEDRDCYPGGWAMMQDMAYRLSDEIEATRTTIKNLFDGVHPPAAHRDSAAA